MRRHFYHVDNPERVYRHTGQLIGTGELGGKTIQTYTDDRTGERFGRLSSEWRRRMRPAPTPVLESDPDPVSETSFDRLLKQLRFRACDYGMHLQGSSYQMPNIWRPLLYVLSGDIDLRVNTVPLGPEYCVVGNLRDVVDRSILLTTTDEVLGGLVPYEAFTQWGLYGVHPGQHSALMSLLKQLRLAWPSEMLSVTVYPLVPGKVRLLRVSPRIRLEETRPEGSLPRWITIDIPYSW